MALPNIPTAVRCGLTYTAAGFWRCTNVFNVETSESDPEVIAGAVAGAFYEDDSFCELQSENVIMQDISIQKYDGTSGADLFAAGDLGLANTEGKVVSAPVSPQVAGVITWRTALATRSGRGRSYIGGLAQTRVDELEGKLENSFIDPWRLAAQTFWDQVVANLPAASLVVVSMKNEEANDVTAFAARVPLRSQRRRATRVV